MLYHIQKTGYNNKSKELVLSDLFLAKLPSEIGDLVNLQTVNLSNNQLNEETKRKHNFI